jgi:predicted flavoprotein YhiN
LVYQITREQRLSLLHLIKNLTLTVKSARSFAEAITTAGGVNTREINAGTMESKLVPGLYFTGEVIDVDGYTGGYNLQIAWSTGHLAGESV